MSESISQQEKEELLRYLVQFTSIEKRFPLLPGVAEKATQAAVIGISEEMYTSVLQNLDEVAKQGALELLKDDTVVKQLKKLPFADGDVVLLVGDSLSDDRSGWFEMLRYAYELATGSTKVSFVNSAVYGDTSVHVLQRFDRDVLAKEPDWVMVALGTTDAIRMNYASNKTMLSLAEFWENINVMQLAVKEITSNPVVWITPPPVMDELLDASPMLNFMIDEEDLQQFRQVMAGKEGIIVDPIGKRLGVPAEAWNFQADGYHLSSAGHIATVRALLTAFDKSF